jgi:hypothetical protein
MGETPDKKSMEQIVELKLFPIKDVNDKGYRIAGYYLKKKNKLPFASTDGVDYYLMNLFNWAKERSKKPEGETIKDFNKHFFKSFTKDIRLFTPVKWVRKEEKEEEKEEKKGGTKKNGKKKITRRKNTKNRTRKNANK